MWEKVCSIYLAFLVFGFDCMSNYRVFFALIIIRYNHLFLWNLCHWLAKLQFTALNFHFWVLKSHEYVVNKRSAVPRKLLHTSFEFCRKVLLLGSISDMFLLTTQKKEKICDIFFNKQSSAQNFYVEHVRLQYICLQLAPLHIIAAPYITLYSFGINFTVSIAMNYFTRS